MKRILVSLLAAFVAFGALVPAFPRAANADEAAPQAELYMVDSGERTPNLPAQCETANQRFGWGQQVRDTIGNDNSDCAKIRIANPASRYGQDFRICFSLGSGWDETTRCTPWASQGGGDIPVRTSTYDWAIGFMQVWTETRPLTGGAYVEDVRIGIQWYELPDRGSCGASGGMQWAYASGGPSESGWTFGGARDNDPGCARIALSARYVAPYDAAFAGSNLSAAPLTANKAYALADGLRVTMRNAGHTWDAGTSFTAIGNCDGYEPGPDAAPCTYVKAYSSPNVKLERRDSEPFAFGANLIPFRREVTVTHSSREVTLCVPTGSVSAASPAASSVIRAAAKGFLGIPVAHALLPEPPLEPEPENEPPCEPQTQWVEVVSETPGTAVIAPDTANFPMTFTAPGPGTYTLRFQMRKTDGPAAGTDAEGRFGDIAEVPVVVRDSGAGIGLACSVAEVTVEPGGTAAYALTVSSQGGFAGQVGVQPSGMPAGATSAGATVNVAASSSASAIVSIVTASSTPAGISNVLFTATASGVAPATCTSALIVQGPAGQEPTLRVSPSRASVRVGQGASFDAFYDPDGSGSAPERSVTGAAAWSVAGSLASSDGAGRFTGIGAGTAYPRASYAGLSSTATLVVTGDDEPSGPVLSVQPAAAVAAPGEQRAFAATYDPDGAGPQAPQDVSAQAGWSASQSGVARNDGGGRFTALAVGSTLVTASHAGLSSSASLTVAAAAPNNSCSFGASPVSLFIPPSRATTLSWRCQQPTTCQVTNVTSGGVTVATGGQTGTGQDRPARTTTYRLGCADGTVETAQVRVFDVTTRVEILPR